MSVFTPEQFAEMFPKAADGWAQAFEAACDEFWINSPKRAAAFFANVSHESAGLTRLEESFAYSTERLRAVWPSMFKTDALAEDYAKRGPQAIANKVYGFRMGNGDEKSGDGFRYRGRGPFMLTGANNYRNCGTRLSVPLWSKPDQALIPTIGARIAGAFWMDGGMNQLSDVGNFDAICDLINKGHRTAAIGDAIGFEDRAKEWARVKGILGVLWLTFARRVEKFPDAPVDRTRSVPSRGIRSRT